ncbi:M61 family metallopeptidase [bacterium]|nr:M61 family metallopeptidase [bacterium]
MLPIFVTPHAYTLRIADPAAHLFEVSLTVAEPDPAGQVLALPAWIPGSYLVRDFAKNIVALTADCDGAPVALTQLDQHSWQAAPCAGPLCVTARIHAFDTSVRTAYLDTERGFFNGTAGFLRVQGQAQHACSLEVVAPEHADWKLATTMPSAGAQPWGFGKFVAPDYDTLIDHPLEMGDFAIAEFDVQGTPHAFVLTEAADHDSARLCDDTARVCAEHAALFGELPPQRYLFLTQVVGQGYGGLEHKDCSALVVQRGGLPAPGMDAPDEAYTTALGLISHEYFHLWNVKRIQPEAVAQSDLTAAAAFEDLWAYEGVTSYYDDLALARSGVIDDAAYLDLLAKQLTRLQRNAGRHGQSLAQSSFTAWTKFYQQDANAANAIVSYYNKGAVVACALDLTLRLQSDGATSLDDVMRALWAKHGSTGVPVPDNTIEAFAANLPGVDLGDFFDRYVRGTDDVPLDQLLASFGVRAICRPRTGQDDQGGRANSNGQTAPAWFGATLADGRQPRVQRVDAGSPAEQAGLAPGDRLVAIDDVEASTSSVAACLARKAPGQTVRLHAMRRGRLLATDAALAPPQADTWTLTLDAAADDAATQRRTAWLASRQAPAAAQGRAAA